MKDSELAYTICNHLLDNALEQLNSKNAVLTIFNYLKDLIPFERILCFKVYRSKVLMDIVLDYSPETYSNKLLKIKAINIIPWEKIFYNSKEHEPLLLENIKDSSVPELYNSNFPCPIGSAIALILEADEKENTLSLIYFINSQINVINKQHYDIIKNLKTTIIYNANRLLEENQGDYIDLNTNGSILVAPDDLLRECSGLKEVVRRIDMIAPTSDTVLITGQTGVGKELVVESIHSLSPRRRGPLVKVNCGAIPDNLIDSELFGHEKGSFTGANTQHTGYFEQAIGGTIYLDEIGELPLQAQVRLLRVLESRELRRVGGTKVISIDVRVVSATNRDLWSMVEDGLFRDDLWYRLNVFHINIPPLSDRAQDIPGLIKHFYQKYIKEKKIINPPRLNRNFVQELSKQHWKGNVRELRYAVERALLFAIADASNTLRPDINTKQNIKSVTYGQVDESQAEAIRLALKKAKGRIQGNDGAAELLKISPSTLRHRMMRFGIPLPSSGKVI